MGSIGKRVQKIGRTEYIALGKHKRLEVTGISHTIGLSSPTQ